MEPGQPCVRRSGCASASGGPNVQEVNADPVDLGPELGMRVDARLRRPPVVLVAPVGAEFLDVGQRNALGPVVDGLGLRKARTREPVAQIVEFGVADFDAEGVDVGHGGASVGKAAQYMRASSRAQWAGAYPVSGRARMAEPP